MGSGPACGRQVPRGPAQAAAPDPLVQCVDLGAIPRHALGLDLHLGVVQPSRVLVMDPHLLNTLSKGSVDATANGAQAPSGFVSGTLSAWCKCLQILGRLDVQIGV